MQNFQFDPNFGRKGYMWELVHRTSVFYILSSPLIVLDIILITTVNLQHH